MFHCDSYYLSDIFWLQGCFTKFLKSCVKDDDILAMVNSIQTLEDKNCSNFSYIYQGLTSIQGTCNQFSINYMEQSWFQLKNDYVKQSFILHKIFYLENISVTRRVFPYCLPIKNKGCHDSPINKNFMSCMQYFFVLRTLSSVFP